KSSSGDQVSFSAMEDTLRLDIAAKSGAIRSMTTAQGYLVATMNALDSGDYILKKLHDIAVQASDDNKTTNELSALNVGAEILGDEFHKLMTTANFKGKPVFSETNTNMKIGTGVQDTSIDIGIKQVEYDDLYDHINSPENSITTGITYEITKPLTNDQKETILARTSGLNAAQLVVGAQFTVIDQAANPNSDGIHTKDLYYVDGNNTVTFDPTAIVSSTDPDTDFKSGYLDITISNKAETSDDLNIISGNGLSSSIVKTGNAIRYVDPTHGSMHIGNIDPSLHGQNSKGLRINFFDQIIIPNTSTILNGDFSNGLANWTAYEDRVNFGNNFTLADGSSIPTPTDLQMATVTYDQGSGNPHPSVLRNDNVALSSMPSFDVNVDNGKLKLEQGRFSVQVGYGIVHGPAAVSDTFSATVGDVLRLDYTATGNHDDYHVAGYVFNTTTNAITLAINETGTTGSGRKSVEITEAGNYRFVFVNGTFDRSGGLVVGADMTIDNIESEKQYSIPDAAVQQLLRSTSYSSSSDNQHYVKDVTISANDGTNIISDTSKIFNTEYEGKIMVAPTLNLEKPVSFGATNSLGPGGAADPSVVVSKIEEVQTRIGSAKAEAKAHYSVLESAIESSTDMRAQFFWGADAISDPEFFADTAYSAKQQIMQNNAAAILAQANKSQGGLMTLVDSPNTIEA
ncbi:hypothetical protein OAJ10_03280, partial [Paracoccaceae bacterium]|nr:hypothetical protein [Paracoccaceae bacterium]